MSKNVRRIAGWVIDPVGSIVREAGGPSMLPTPANLVNTVGVKRPNVAVPVPPPPPSVSAPGPPQVRINAPQMPKAPTLPAMAAPLAPQNPKNPRAGSGDVGDRTKGLVSGGGNRTLLA